MKLSSKSSLTGDRSDDSSIESDNKTTDSVGDYWFICHNCISYKTHKKSDIKRHLSKMKKCSRTYMPTKMITEEEAAKLSVTNRYYLLFDADMLYFNDYIYIVNTFTNPVNYVTYKDIVASKPHLQSHLPIHLTTLLAPQSGAQSSRDMSTAGGSQSTTSLTDQRSTGVCCDMIRDLSITSGGNLSSSTKTNDELFRWCLVDPNKKDNDAPHRGTDDLQPPAVDMSMLISQQIAVPQGGAKRVDDSLLPTGSLHDPKKVEDQISKDIKFDINMFQPSWEGTSCPLGLMDFEDHHKVVPNDIYKCPRCLSEYKYKKDLVNHSKNRSLCDNRRSLNSLLISEESSDLSNIVESGKEVRKNIINSLIQHNTAINNNTQNIFHNTVKLNIKDFGRELYDYTHIKRSFAQQNDFFLYPNFLNKLLENEVNRNIFFIDGNKDTRSENRYAIIYADKIFYRICEDKAIYMILVKLNETIQYFLPRAFKEGTEEEKKKIAEILRYYRVITGHFKHDTIFKDYRIDEEEFYNLDHKRRSRDLYTTKIKMIIYSIGTPISDLVTPLQAHSLELFQPDIEDYASTRIRNKDLRKRKEDMLF